MKIAIVGGHGVGKTTISRQIYKLIKEVVEVKVGVTGAHGTGKTTVSKHLAGRMRMRFMPEMALQALQAGFPVNEKTEIETQLWIMMKQIEQERYTAEPWIADKCLIDSLAYGLYLIKETRYQEMMWELVKRNANYDYVFYLPIEFDIEDDGFRSLDPVFQKEIDKLILMVMRAIGIKYHILTGSKEERYQQARKILGF